MLFLRAFNRVLECNQCSLKTFESLSNGLYSKKSND